MNSSLFKATAKPGKALLAAALSASLLFAGTPLSAYVVHGGKTTVVTPRGSATVVRPPTVGRAPVAVVGRPPAVVVRPPARAIVVHPVAVAPVYVGARAPWYGLWGANAVAAAVAAGVAISMAAVIGASAAASVQQTGSVVMTPSDSSTPNVVTDLQWTNVTNAKSYQVLYGNNPDQVEPLIKLAAGTTTYNLPDKYLGQKYYAVVGYDASGKVVVSYSFDTTKK